MSTLYHPNTGRAIEVAERDVADWQKVGWLDEAPVTDADPQADSDDKPEGDADEAKVEGDTDEVDTEVVEAEVEPAAPKTTRTTTRKAAAK